MFNAVNKYIALGLCFLFVSCSNTDEKKAKQLLQESESNISSGSYSVAIALLDSLQRTYPKFVEIQRQGMHLRPKAIEGMTLKETASNDSLIAVLEAEHAALKNSFELISNKDLLEGYYVFKDAIKPTLFNCTTIQPRLSAKGEFYIISALNSNSVKHTAISLSRGNESVTTKSVSYDGERNYRSGDTEMITFMPAESDTLGKFALNHDNMKLSLKYIGKRTHTTSISATETHAIAATYRMSQILAKLRKAKMKKELLEQQLLLTRDHIARTFQDSTVTQD